MKILISHSWQDKSVATHLFEVLQKDGHEVWYDLLQLLPGDNIQEVIDGYINQCDVMILLWSFSASKSAGVDAEIQTAQKAGKRIIPVTMDETSLGQHEKLQGLLGIPMEDFESGLLLLRRGLLLLMVSEADKNTEWYNKAFGNIRDLGGYLNYVNTYRLPKNMNDDGAKEDWKTRLENLVAENEYIKNNLMPAASVTMKEMQAIMQQLEHGEVSFHQLEEYEAWCTTNQNFHPKLIGKLQAFIQKDKHRLSTGGEPVRALNYANMEKQTGILENAINHKKREAYDQMTAKVNSYAGWLLGTSMVHSIVTSYQNYVIASPKLMLALVKEAKVSEFVAVRETACALYQYMVAQDRQAEMQQAQFEGFFDDAYFINNTIKLLIEAELIKKESFPQNSDDFGLVNTYITYVLDAPTKEKLDAQLLDIRNMIGLKKNEINWGHVALFVLGAAAVVGGISALSDGGDSGREMSEESSGGANFEDKVADFSAKYGGGLTDYL